MSYRSLRHQEDAVFAFLGAHARKPAFSDSGLRVDKITGIRESLAAGAYNVYLPTCQRRSCAKVGKRTVLRHPSSGFRPVFQQRAPALRPRSSPGHLLSQALEMKVRRHKYPGAYQDRVGQIADNAVQDYVIECLCCIS